MAGRVVLLGDTHLPRFGRVLPAPLVEVLVGADLILHAGDITEAFVLDLLAEHARVVAVAGNNDGPELGERLGIRRIVELDGLRIGLTHGHAGRGRTTPERAWNTFAADGRLDAVAFGHSHQPLVDRRGGTWLLNPGSPTDRRRQPSYSCLELTVANGNIKPRLIEWSPDAGGARKRRGTGTRPASRGGMTNQLQRDPEEWKTGDEPMTPAQASYLRTLSEDAGEPFEEGLTKAQASERIDELQGRSPRLNPDAAGGADSGADDDAGTTAGQASGTPPHPSPADGGSSEAAGRPPRPSQAEGER